MDLIVKDLETIIRDHKILTIEGLMDKLKSIVLANEKYKNDLLAEMKAGLVERIQNGTYTSEDVAHLSLERSKREEKKLPNQWESVIENSKTIKYPQGIRDPKGDFPTITFAMEPLQASVNQETDKLISEMENAITRAYQDKVAKEVDRRGFNPSPNWASSMR